MIATADDVLSFWFPPNLADDEQRHRAQIRWWFQGGDEVDRAIRERFAETHAAAVRGELDDWAKTPRGRRALVIVLDQFSRNLHRGTPKAFENDLKSARLVLEAMERGELKDLTSWELTFMLVALSHSEDLALQDIAMKWAEEPLRRAPAHLRSVYEISREQTRAHRDEIVRFGRHPARNVALGRTSTKEELEYLQKEGPANERPARQGKI